MLALVVSPADEGDRAKVGSWWRRSRRRRGSRWRWAFVDQGYTGERAAGDAAAHGIRLEVVKLPQARRGFVLLPRRWVVERSFAWLARFRRLARDYERLPETLGGLHLLAFSMLLLKRFATLMAEYA